MLSDICAQMIEDIRGYQADGYKYIRIEVDKVKIVLWSLQYYLDSPPPVDDPPFEEARERLRLAMRDLDVSGLVHACQNLYRSWHEQTGATPQPDIPPLDMAGILSIHPDVFADNRRG